MVCFDVQWRLQRRFMVRGTAYVLFVLLSLAAARAQETSVETPKSALTAGEREAPSEAQQSICLLIESAAHSNGLPVEFFVRLIWQESRFRADAVGPVTRNGKRALGIAQFMPGTAAERDLLDPLNPIQALPKAAEFLKDLRRQFGNLGLAAAAYNAGPRRVREWMAGESPMPSETRAYVQAVTGTSVNQWATGGDLNSKGETGLTCDKAMALLKRAPTTFIAALEQRVVSGAIQPWGAILGSNRSRPEVLARYSALQQRYSAVLAGRDPILFERRRGALPRYQIRVGAETRAAANDLCNRIHTIGGDCVVLRNPGS
jgi:Transglycosylase SLT domain/SPOR domain